MDSLVLKQEELMEQLTRAYTNYKKTPKERLTASYIETKVENLEKLWEIFNNVHFEIITIASKEDKKKKYFTDDCYGELEDTYTNYKARMKDDLKRLTAAATPSTSHSQPSFDQANINAIPSCQAKLPQIQLPRFSGNYEEWQSFYDMFVSLIHTNDNLSAVQKLHYLKTSLVGEPESLIKNLSTTATNYDEAWKLLIRRYNNKRYNSNEILKRLFAQKNVIGDSASSIKQLLDTTSACLKSLNNIDINTDSWDVIINYIVVSRLDPESRKSWEVQISQSDSDNLPTWSSLVKFLETRFRSLEMVDSSKQSKPINNFTNKQVSRQKSFHSTVQEKKIACVLCPGQHLLYQCQQFQNQSPQERSDFVQSKRLCFNCFASNHSVKNCRQSTCCRRCGRRHHTLLHFERSQPTESSPSAASSGYTVPEESETRTTNTERRVTAHFVQKTQSDVLLATAVVKAVSPNGYSQLVRALIDQGSEASFVSEATVQSLGLERVPVSGLVSGVGEGETRTKSMVALQLESLHNPDFSVRVNAFVLSTLTSFLPTSKVTVQGWPEVEDLELADPHYGEPGRIDLLLGVEIHSEIILSGLLKHPRSNGPVAQNTQFGWVLSGPAECVALPRERIINLHLRVKEDELLKKFWEVEREPDTLNKKMTRDEKRCEEIFERTTERDKDGRYKVRLPFKNTEPECLYGQSDIIARRRFLILEKRLMKNPSLKEEYAKVIDDYIKQNHMIKLKDVNEINNPRSVYLPHHAVIRPDKETTKVRVVYDASCKGTNNVSLNDTLLVGPKLQQDLRHILMRWRRHPICIAADLIQMYRQVLVHEDDTNFQRILWRPHPDQIIQSYKLLRLTFGTSSAPYLAVKCLQQLAKDERHRFPLAAEVTIEDFYMDDLLTGCELDSEAVKIFEEMNNLMRCGGFCLQKWCSNSEVLLNHIRQDCKNTNQALTFKSDDNVKILGICWNKITDNFEYKYQLPGETSLATKRKVLSEIARLYDPLGWIAPVTVRAKIYIQKLWKSGLAWDDNLTPGLMKEWLLFRNDLINVRNITIPRWLNSKQRDNLELHTFADASQAAYAGAVYIKVIDDSGNVSVNLVTAKTKVAPVEKEMSIPRLELCAALLASKLIFEVSQIMKIPKHKLHAWSDSTVVLAWIRGEPSHWTTFVSNRVSEILTILDREQWSHIKTDQNPSDCASRGMSSVELKDHKLWWHGPKFLSNTMVYVADYNFSTNEEQRSIKTLTALVEVKEESIWMRFSNLQRALRVLSYCRRMLNLKLPKEQRVINNFVTTREMEEVMEIGVRASQNLYFAVELKQLKSQGVVPKSSLLHTLNPFLDKKGILRVGGRINFSSAKFDKKHPIIVPGECHFTKLIISDAHIKTLHGGPQIMLNLLRSKFWIVRGRDRVKKHYRDCVICTRYARQNNNQLMGQLPKARVTPTKPFKQSGVDFTGYINVRFSPGRGSKSYKGYVCIFVCMVTRAIHLEAVSDLTAQGFIAAYRRFVSRRGYCQDLYSDNGTNFIGADKELRIMFNTALSQLPQEIAHLLVNEGTTWHFIPPHAPNFGGLWEAGVRSTKAHLRRVVGDSTLTFEELTTVLTQIEACLNSRPLSYISDDPNDPLPLTPGHFLVGEPLIVIPDEDLSRVQVSSLKRWKLTQKLVQDYWKKWSDEYLVTLNQRFKWYTKRTEPEINDVVILRDSNIPPAKWLLGRIVEKHPGKDNITRVVTLQTKNGLCKRPCNKLCFLRKEVSS